MPSVLRTSMLAAPLVAVFQIAGPAMAQTPDHEAQMKMLTPVLYVEAIEPLLPFWEGRLGFERTMEVPHGDRLGFVGLQKDEVEVMVQTRASVTAEFPGLADTPIGGALLFIEVYDIDAVEAALEGAEILHPRRKTFYGSTEIIVREPGGNVVTFAEFGEAE